jgi:glycine/D-amino acid oxidase-like deaminating enzyme
VRLRDREPDDRGPDDRRPHRRRLDRRPDGLGQRYRRLSLWLDACGDDLAPRPPLPGDRDVDVAIVGAGYTGLWTAYYLAVADPGLRIAVVEREIAGFGASGRNGGWCSALFAASGQPVAMRRAMVDTVDEVGRVTATEGIDAGYHKGGTLRLATNPAQVARIRSEVDGASGLDSRWLDAAEARERLDVPGVLGAAFTPHCARIHPARLVRGLVRAVDARGVAVYERTPAVAVHPRDGAKPAEVITPAGRLRAEVVVRATEAYTADRSTR